MPPATLEGIEKYLGSSLIKGIGPHYSKKLVEAFGEAVFDVIEQTPQRLLDVKGIGSLRAEKISKGWSDQKIIREIMIFLHAHGVGTTRAVRIFKTYGNEAIALISENPYRLAKDIRGIGFVTADAIAAKMGIEPTSLIRARAGLTYTLTKSLDEGHCGLPETLLMKRTMTLLSISDGIVLEALNHELSVGELIRDNLEDIPAIFLPGLFKAEQGIARKLKSLSSCPPPYIGIESDKAIPWAEQKLNISLSSSQKEAIQKALISKVMVITGGPGVGKTTLINSLIHILSAKGYRISLCAPTGRAAKRLSESTQKPAKTIHRLLEVNPVKGGYKKGEENPLECDVLIIDETSMVDVLCS